MFKLLILFFCAISTPLVWTQKAPRSLPWLQWANMLISGHLINMTGELITDTTYKLRHAEKIKEMHAGSVTFELGFIAAGIQERFYRMLEIYKKYADLRDLKKATYTMWELMNAYHVIQGDYNEIRLEKSMFQDIIRKYESTTTNLKSFEEYTSSTGLKEESPRPGHTFRPPKRRAMTWRPNLYYDFPMNKYNK